MAADLYQTTCSKVQRRLRAYPLLGERLQVVLGVTECQRAFIEEGFTDYPPCNFFARDAILQSSVESCEPTMALDEKWNACPPIESIVDKNREI